MPHIHIGKRIKEVLDASGFSAIEFAKEINRTRDVVYKICAKESIDTALLQKISEVLEHDFFNYYSQALPVIKEPGKIGYIKKTDLISSLGDELKEFKKKLHSLEEQYETLQKLNRLQEEKLSRLEKKGKK
ncbi:MAG: transposase [Bacteroidota bacterium]|jgi:transcriptional regulator with XRE-family HTH domain|nr:transposase [Bacteroidota bacterium]